SGSTHTHTHLCSALMVAALVACGLNAQRAQAQAFDEYRMTPIVKINFIPNVLGDLTGMQSHHGTMGINNKGQVVYGYKLEPDGQATTIRAWAWLPTADYNMSAGFH